MTPRPNPNAEVVAALEMLETAERPDNLLDALVLVERERDRRSIAMWSLFAICLVVSVAAIGAARHLFGDAGQFGAMFVLSIIAGAIWNNKHVRHWRRLSDASGKWQHLAPLMRNGQ